MLLQNISKIVLRLLLLRKKRFLFFWVELLFEIVLVSFTVSNRF